MELPNDDSLRSFDRRFYGPKGLTLWWAARYTAYPVGAAALLVTFIIVHKIMGNGPTPILITVIVGVGITTLIMKRVDPEKSVGALFKTFWHELGTPRRPKPTTGEVRIPVLKRKVTA